MLSKGFFLVLVSVLGVSVLSGCRSNKSTFSYAAPQPSEIAIASVGPPAPTQLAEEMQLAAATTYSKPDATPTDSAYVPSTYSASPKASSSGCCSR